MQLTIGNSNASQQPAQDDAKRKQVSCSCVIPLGDLGGIKNVVFIQRREQQLLALLASKQ